LGKNIQVRLLGIDETVKKRDSCTGTLGLEWKMKEAHIRFKMWVDAGRGRAEVRECGGSSGQGRLRKATSGGRVGEKKNDSRLWSP